MDKSYYFLSFSHLTNEITGGKHLLSSNEMDIEVLLSNNINHDDYRRCDCAQLSLAYLIMSEYVHEQILPKAITMAFRNFDPSKNDCERINRYFNMKIIEDMLIQIEEDENKSNEYMAENEISVDEGFIENKSIFSLGELKVGKCMHSIEIILTVLLQYINLNDEKDSYSIILKTYLPEILFSYITNYKDALEIPLFNATGKEFDKLKRKLSCPQINLSIYNNNVRSFPKAVGYGIKAYKYSMIHNAILQSYNFSNYTLSFLWFERNVGTYQYFFTRREYTELINYICGYEPDGTFEKINIQKSVSLYRNLATYQKINVDKLFDYTLDCIGIDVSEKEFYDRYFKIPNSNLSLIASEFELLEHFSECASEDKDVFKETEKLMNYVVSIDDEQSLQMSHTLISFIFFNDMWHRENFVKTKTPYAFKCESINSSLFQMRNVIFDYLLVDVNTEPPNGFQKMAYSDSLDILYPSKYAEKTYDGKNKYQEIFIPECIVNVIPLKEVNAKLKRNKAEKSESQKAPRSKVPQSMVKIDNKPSPQKTGLFYLRDAKFKSVTCECLKDPDLPYNHIDWARLYVSISDSEFDGTFGIYFYFKNFDNDDSISSNNISANAMSSYSSDINRSSFSDKRSSRDYENAISNNLSRYKGTCSAYIYGSSCSGLSSIQMDINSEKRNAQWMCEQIREKHNAISNTNCSVIELKNLLYFQDRSTGYIKQHLMDIYYPYTTSYDLYPVIVTINCEKLCFNDKEMYSPYAQSIANKGFAVVNFNFRTINEYRFEDGLVDICQLMNHLQANSEKYCLDMSKLFIIGNCSGAFLAAKYTLLSTNSSYNPLPGSMKSTLNLTAPKKIALNNGIYRFEENSPNNCPFPLTTRCITESFDEMIAYIDKYFPPTYISYSVNNALHASADRLTERLGEVKVQYISKKYGLLDNNLTDDFVFDVSGKAASDCICSVIEFFRKK